jgi:hypothetical protein
MPETRYQRLTRSRARSTIAVAFQSRTSLWLGPDHLLCVDSSGYSESYKRFYFRDIQAISIQGTKRRAVWNVILVMPIVICLTGLLTDLSSTIKNNEAIIIWLSILAIFLVPFLLNNFFGTACRCQLRTAVQIEELPSLCRVRKTRRIVEKIRPLIVAAQGGEISADAVSARMRDHAVFSPEVLQARIIADDPNVPPESVS